jgi:transposase
MRQVSHVIRDALREPRQFVIENVGESQVGIVIQVRGRKKRLPCPTYSRTKVSYHSRYQRARRVRDLPWQGKEVIVEIRPRRFRCRNRRCPTKVFVERFLGLAPPLARHTPRLAALTRRIGYAVGGLPGSRLLHLIGAPMSDDTVLRRVKAPSVLSNVEPVRILGVDDWAWQKQESYGTMLMDLERYMPLEGNQKPKQLIATPLSERLSAISPDGNWLAYGAEGDMWIQLFLTRFPSAVGRWQVSPGMGLNPR